MMDKWDYLVITLILAHVVIALLGPFMGVIGLAHVFAGFLVVYLSIFFTLTFIHWIKFMVILRRIRQTVAMAKDMESAPLLESVYTHAFVIPNYCESPKLLEKTLSRLSAHRDALTNYVIILAMEAREEGHMEKANDLKEKYSASFKDIIISAHPQGILGEAPGKGSNVNFAVRVGYKALAEKEITPEQTIVTIMDSDSDIPELYIHCMEKALQEAADPQALMFIPFIFFSRNGLRVPASVRLTDAAWSAMHIQNMANFRGLPFPCSTYSLSLALAHKVDYWDPDDSAIGEEMHMFLKCHVKTHGAVRGFPIYVPVNMTSVECPGYLANLHARYVQAKRHYLGSADVGYTLRWRNELPTKTWRQWWDRFIVLFHVFEAHMIPPGSGWIIGIALPVFGLMNNVILPPTDNTYDDLFLAVKIISAVVGLPSVLLMLFYETLYSEVDKLFPDKDPKEKRKWYHLTDYIWIPVSGFFFMGLPSVVACLQRVFKKTAWQVSKKGAF